MRGTWSRPGADLQQTCSRPGAVVGEPAQNTGVDAGVATNIKHRPNVPHSLLALCTASRSVVSITVIARR